jgi:hypothetical protein
LGPTIQVLAGYRFPTSKKYVTKIGRNVEIFGRDKLLSDAQFAALSNATKDHVRNHFQTFGLGNKEGSQTKLILFFSKLFLSSKSLNTARFRSKLRDSQTGTTVYSEHCVPETSRRKSAANQVYESCEFQQLAEEIDQLRNTDVGMQEHILA